MRLNTDPNLQLNKKYTLKVMRAGQKALTGTDLFINDSQIKHLTIIADYCISVNFTNFYIFVLFPFINSVVYI